MKFNKLNIIAAVTLILVVVIACKKAVSNSQDTILKGKTSILVDETVRPIIEDEIAVFENEYDAKINLIAFSEKEVVNELSNLKSRIAVLSRNLTANEIKYFQQKTITPKITPFAIDGIAAIRKKSTDTLIDLQQIVNFIRDEPSTIKGLVFDNPNSSTVRLLCEKAKVDAIPIDKFYSFKTNEEVTKYVSQNDGYVGFIGINWVFQPSLNMENYLQNVNVLSVKDVNKKEYFYPSQEYIATGDYPLARDLYIINCQGYEGLGMGISSFIAGERGQRIILKSGLVPVRFPSRNIRIKNK